MSLLKTGRPSTKSAKELAIEAVQDTSDEIAVPPAQPAKPEAKPKMQRFNVDLPVELHRAVKAQAAKEGMKLNELASQLFREYLNKNS